jgi:hypothetical protein
MHAPAARRQLEWALAVVSKAQPKEFAIKGHILIVPAAVLATATAVAVLDAEASDRSPTLDPGFVPNTGQINPGHAAEPWSDALPQAPQPPQEEARAALMMPDNGAPSAGPGPTPAPNGGEQLSTSASTSAGGRAGPVGPIGATTQPHAERFGGSPQRTDKC